MAAVAPLSAGAIRLEIAVDPETRAARRVTVRSTRPTGFSGRLLAGRSAGEVPALLARMHALCGRSHWVAAETSIIAAMGRDVEPIIAERMQGLAAERLGEHLRAMVTGSGVGGVDATDRETLADVRAVLAGVHALLGTSVGGPPTEATGAIDRIRGALLRLGPTIDRRGRLAVASGSWAAQALEAIAAETDDRFGRCDGLRPSDDDAVIAGLTRDPEGFSALPRLAGRRPEAGPAARAATSRTLADGRFRLAARLAEIAEAAELLDAPLDDRLRIGADWVCGRQVGPRTGHAAVESPRGRLHHLARVDEDGRVVSWAIVAPTEWNFHPDGPLAATLAANVFPAGAEGLARAERIGALFDPCVGWDAAIEEMLDA